MRTAVDTNILSALWSAEPRSDELSNTLEETAAEGALVICPVVYAELLAHPKASPDFVDDFLAATDILIDFSIGESVWREVAARFAKYAVRRRASRGGSPKRLVADFVVGAHALIRARTACSLSTAPATRATSLSWN
jgi:predicted nucleic acid-binding protein